MPGRSIINSIPLQGAGFLPTTGEYGMFNGSYGDYDMHEKVATRVGVHFTRSDETRQGQPTNDAFENVSLRVSDGSSIFLPNLFNPGTQIDEARDQMFSVDAGAKLKGFALEGEYYWRKIDNFKLIGSPMALDKLNDEGFQLLASAMVVPKKLQLYTTYSKSLDNMVIHRKQEWVSIFSRLKKLFLSV
jgi:hypothetical protein